MDFLRTSGIERWAAALARGAALELSLTPKPGLVDRWDRGSHPDLSFALMDRSVRRVSAYLEELAQSLGRGEPFASQADIARRTEQEMREDLGSNTHKGYLFLSGILLIARGRARTDDERAIRGAVSTLASDFFASGRGLPTHGQRARELYRIGGIVRESVDGFPALFEEALPSYRSALARHGSPRTASFSMMARLMQSVEDTTALHRCGVPGLARIRRDGAYLESLIERGGDAVAFLSNLNRDYVGMNLTMGGVADMLALAYGCLAALGEIPDGEDPTEEKAPYPLLSRSASMVRT